ncbi:hypothetical protein AVEN_149781-1, partial [Araneus ventricosus]
MSTATMSGFSSPEFKYKKRKRKIKCITQVYRSKNSQMDKVAIITKLQV